MFVDVPLLYVIMIASYLIKPASPFLFGRCLWIGSKFPDQLSDASTAAFVEATVRGLQAAQAAAGSGAAEQGGNSIDFFLAQKPARKPARISAQKPAQATLCWEHFLLL